LKLLAKFFSGRHVFGAHCTVKSCVQKLLVHPEHICYLLNSNNSNNQISIAPYASYRGAERLIQPITLILLRAITVTLLFRAGGDTPELRCWYRERWDERWR